MKKIIVVLAVLLMAAPAMAVVEVSATDLGGPVLAIKFTNTAAPGVKVRAIALDITADGGAKIIAVTDENASYDIHPGSIVIDPCNPLDPGDGTIDQYGQALCDPGYPGTQPGIGTQGVTIEMASLTASGPQSDVAIIRVQTNGGCNVTVDENTIRGGGFVMENMTVPDTNMPATFAVAGGCACKGEVYVDQPLPTPVTAFDCFQIIQDLTVDVIPPVPEIHPGEPNYKLCGAILWDDGAVGMTDEPYTAFDCFALIQALTPGQGNPIACLP
jgi:hypothetical protein